MGNNGISEKGRLLIVIHTFRKESEDAITIRVISSRKATKRPPFQDAFILEAIEGNRCYCCGGFLSDDKIDVIVELGKMSKDPDVKFAKITAWIDARSDIEGWIAGPLFDPWYGVYEDIEHSSEPGAKKGPGGPCHSRK